MRLCACKGPFIFLYLSIPLPNLMLYLHCAVLLYPQAPSTSFGMQLRVPVTHTGGQFDGTWWRSEGGIGWLVYGIESIHCPRANPQECTWAHWAEHLILLLQKKPASLSPLPTGSFYSQVQSMCGAAWWTMSSPRLWAYVTNKLRSIIWLVSGVICLATLCSGHRILLSPMG